MALRFDLKPGERFYLNGAIIESDQKASIRLHNKAAFLRCSEIMYESEVTSPARSLYFHVMKLTLGSEDVELHNAAIAKAAAELGRHLADPETAALLRELMELLDSERGYKALTRAGALVRREAALLDAAEGAAKGPVGQIKDLGAA
ncbi:MAG: hypothetical protein KGO51_05475 [Alphaproteobacteria bacterium]|nr:hypothetical protein [Alphaproteobacteria bacterium]